MSTKHPFANATKVSSFSKDIQFTESKIPAPSDDFVQKFKENSGARKDFSNQHIVDVLPNFVPILTYILYYVNKVVPHLEHTKHAKISAGTFTAYCLSLVYGYILCSDLYLRPTPSAHAVKWEDDVNRQRFVEYLFTLPVPDFIAPILQKLTPTTSDRRGNIQFIPSAAGFTYYTHFGRFFPIIMFTNLHDVAAETASNTNPAEVFVQYLSRSLYTLARVSSNVTNFDASPAHFLGTFFKCKDQHSTYGNKLEQVFQTVFNPVLFRDYQRRQTLASVSLCPIEYPDPHVSFYDLVFSASPANLTELRVVFQSIASAMSGNIKCPGDLASFFKTFSGNNILRHGYSTYALPTWHHSAIEFPDSGFKRPVRVTPADFSAAVRFLRVPEKPKLEELTQPSGICQIDKEHQVKASFNSPLNLQSLDDNEIFFPANGEFVQFKEGLHLYPRVYVFDLDGSTVDAWDATAFGMVIESYDLDGTVIPVPNNSLSLGIENSWFADSSLPYYATFAATKFDTSATTTFASAIARVISPRQTRFPAAHLLTDRTKVRLPHYNANSVNAGNKNSRWFPGLYPTQTNWSDWIISFLGFRTADNRSHRLDDDKIPGLHRTLLCWSPYTYTGHEGYDDQFNADYSETHSYFVTNLRTIFGTDVPLIEVSNGLESMPIA